MTTKQDKIDAEVSERGQAEARRYLAENAPLPPAGTIRAALAFALLMIPLVVVALAL